MVQFVGSVKIGALFTAPQSIEHFNYAFQLVNETFQHYYIAISVALCFTKL